MLTSLQDFGKPLELKTNGRFQIRRVRGVWGFYVHEHLKKTHCCVQKSNYLYYKWSFRSLQFTNISVVSSSVEEYHSSKLLHPI